MKKLTNKEKVAVRSFLQEHISNLLLVARLNHYEVEYRFDSPDSNKEFKGSKPASMTMDLDCEYLVSRLSISEDNFIVFWRSGDYYYLISMLCHEIAHILTGEFADRLKIKYSGDGKYYQEKLTEHIGRFIHRLYVTYMDKYNISIKDGKEKRKKKT